MMAAPKKKVEDDEPLRLLREIASIGQNRFCVDCGQRGPTYVNMTIGSFICTSCSGHLRGLNPPHRVKSITMASFTVDEIDFVRSRGNQFCNKVWGPPKEELERRAMVEDGNARLLDLLIQKYERKRWYCQPTDDMYLEARKANTSTASGRQIEASVISHSTQAVSGSQSIPSLHSVHSIQRPSPSSARSSSSQISSPSSPAGQPAMRGGLVTASSSAIPQQQPASTAGEAFANFANFDAVSSSTVGAITSTSQFSPLPQNVFDPMQVQTYSVGVTKPSASDKYAVLASVDTAATAINWNGQMNTTFQSVAPSRPSGDQFVSSICQQYVAVCDAAVTESAVASSTITSTTVSSAAATGATVGSNPFAVGGMYPAAMPIQASPQYILVQTGSGPCYVPVTYAPFGTTVISPPAFSAPSPAQFPLPNPQQQASFTFHGQMHPANPFL